MKRTTLCFTAIFAVFSLFLVSCSQSDEIVNDTLKEQNGIRTYKLQMNCDVPGFDDVATRASTSWSSGSVIYLRFLKGGTTSTYISGKATYNGSSWSFETNGTLTNTSSDVACQVVYVEKAKSTNSTQITLDPMSSILYGGKGTYSFNNNVITVNATLAPQTWRMRFKGTNGNKITLRGAENSIKYVSSVSLSDLSVKTEKQDVSLSVSSTGYTPYIYGTFENANGNNTLCIANDSEGQSYKLTTFSGAKLPIAGSGYLTIPNSTNYRSLDWTPIVNYKLNVIPNQLTVISCGASSDYSCESDVYEFYAGFFVASKLSGMSDDEIKYYLKNNGAYFPYNELDYINRSAIVEPGTNMVLVTLGMSKDGTEGDLYKKSFTIPTASGQPEVTISNIKLESNKASYSVSMNSYCTSYYLRSFDDASEHILFAAWSMEKAINNGADSYIYTSVTTTFNSVTTLTECSIFARGVSSTGKLSNVVNSATYGGSSHTKNRTHAESNDCCAIPVKEYGPILHRPSY